MYRVISFVTFAAGAAWHGATAYTIFTRPKAVIKNYSLPEHQTETISEDILKWCGGFYAGLSTIETISCLAGLFVPQISMISHLYISIMSASQGLLVTSHPKWIPELSTIGTINLAIGLLNLAIFSKLLIFNTPPTLLQQITKNTSNFVNSILPI